MAEKKEMSEKDIEKKLLDLKIEMLKNPTKKKSIKKEIARLLTMKNQNKSDRDAAQRTPKKLEAKE